MEKSYLEIMIGHYNQGFYLDTLLDLMCQQSEMDRLALTTLLASEGIDFNCHIKYFKANGRWVRSKPQDYIVLSKHPLF